MRMTSPMTTAVMTAAMMVAMMLPSFAPPLLHYHRHLRATSIPRAARHTALFALGYAGVWSTLGLALSVFPAAPVSPGLADAIMLLAGAVQCSRWKTKQLLRCRSACVTALPLPTVMTRSLRDGCALGLHCIASCAAPMAILFIAGFMDVRMMLVITAAITAERLAPDGVRIARLTGAIALLAGLGF